jgi:hypothetical protein
MHRSSDNSSRAAEAVPACPAARSGASPISRPPAFSRVRKPIAKLAELSEFAGTPIDSGSASKVSLRPLPEIPEMPQNQRAAPSSALSLLSLFMRQCSATDRAGRSRGFNGLRGFAERHGERDPICRAASQNRCGEPLVSLKNPGGRVGEYLAAQHNVGIRRVLGEVMRDAADRGHEHHGRGQALRQNLRIVAGA